jgi:hypothetical protein
LLVVVEDEAEDLDGDKEEGNVMNIMVITRAHNITMMMVYLAEEEDPMMVDLNPVG